MILRGARVALSAVHAERLDVQIRSSRIGCLGLHATAKAVRVDVSGCMVIPGLINSHDHLEFNLFPRIPTGGPHANHVEWSKQVFHPDRAPISDHLRVPKQVRLLWGGIKNLLSGVTTVAHHNRYEPAVFDYAFPVRVLKRYGWAHSVHFAPEYSESFRRTPKSWPFIIHAGEGTDVLAKDEILELHRAGVLSRRTVLVHAVAAGQSALQLLRESGAGLVWCPSSNLFTLGATLSCVVLRSGTRVSLGTDSALTGCGDLIDEIRVAGQQGHVSPEMIYGMVTSVGAALLNLTDGSGYIREGGRADLLIVSDSGHAPAVCLQEMCPKLVIVGGKVALVSTDFLNRVPTGLTANLKRITLQGRGEYLVAANIAQLTEATKPYLGPDLRLAGRRLCA
jgi:cytosine/adenosine deaminase-related metal-dependent hydrolase